MNGLLDILSGQPSAEYQTELDIAKERAGLVNQSLFEAMIENRQERRLKGAMGTPSVPETPLPQGMAGPPDPAQAGTGYFSENPEEQILAQMLMANINAPAFQPMLTQAVKPEAAPAAIKPGTLQRKKVDTPQGPKEISVRYLGGDVRDPTNWQEVGKGTYFAPYQSKGAGLREEADFNYYQGLHGAADKSADTARNYEYINQTLEGVETGAFDEAILAGQKFAQRLGADSFDTSIAAREAAQSAFSQATIDLMKPDSESGKRALAGQSSDRELEFFKGIPPGLGKTKSGRRLIALVARERARRSDEIAVMAIDAEDRKVPAKQFRAMTRERFKDLEVPAEWNVLLGQAEEEAKSGEPEKPAGVSVVDELPKGFILQADGTARNPETGQIARPQ
jgi:hypothetical protein